MNEERIRVALISAGIDSADLARPADYSSNANPDRQVYVLQDSAVAC